VTHDGVDKLKRKDDTEDSHRAWREEVRRGRARTVFFSVICSGLVTLFLAHAIEVNAYNKRVADSRINCHGLVEIGKVLGKVADDVSKNSSEEDTKKRWLAYGVTFRNIVPPKAPTCEEQFPTRTYLPFLD
jgi:hypothetical protein